MAGITATDHAKRAEAHLERGEWKEAIEACSTAISIDNRFGWAYYARGYAQYKGGDDILALDDLDEAVSLMPNDIEAAHLRASILGSLERHAETIQECSRILNLDPMNGRAYLTRGIERLSAEVKDIENARLDLIKASELGETEAATWLHRVG